MKKHLIFLLCISLLLSVLVACGKSAEEEEQSGAKDLRVCVNASLSTLDPASCTAEGSETVLCHLYENLLRWEDDGTGVATLTLGQAKSYTTELDYEGNVTYTFSLRSDIYWSDGEPVVADDFVYAWLRLANEENNLPYRSLVAELKAPVTQEGEETAWVTAPDKDTLVVTLAGNPAYFLQEICAGAHTMPVRREIDQKSGWGTNPTVTPTNGAYTCTSLTDGAAMLERNEEYYQRVKVETINFVPRANAEDAYNAFISGELDIVSGLSASTLQTLANEGTKYETFSVPATTAVVINTLQAPFDSLKVRQAFRLVIDTQAIVDALGDMTSVAATGIVPSGVSDYGEHESEVEEKVETLPDPNAPVVEEEKVIYWDFRIHSSEIVTASELTDYDSRCTLARTLLAEAGYENSSRFPVVEYIYLESDRNYAIANALRTMWQEELGVMVTIRSVTQEEYDAMTTPESNGNVFTPAAFYLASMELSNSICDAVNYLEPWYGTAEGNLSCYNSAAFNILMDSSFTATATVRDAYLHDAEAILLDDAPVIPLCYDGSAYLVAPSLTGLYRTGTGTFLFYETSRLTE